MPQPVTVAIVGSGPAGFYTAESLIKSDLICEIDIIDRLPTPYGLIRGGVAPDHQTTKNVWRRYEKTALHEQVKFYGNVEVGRDVSIDDLRERYDAVVLAIGSALDRPLGIPGEDKVGVFGAAAFVGWYNGHPDFRDLNPDLNIGTAAVIGVGNVAIDVARVLAKTPSEMAETDLVDYAAKAVHSSPLTDVYMFGRRSAADAKFTNKELREMGELENSVPIVDPAQIPGEVTGEMSDRDRRLTVKNLDTFREFSQRDADEKPIRVHFQFLASPVEVLGGERVEGLRLEKNEVVDGRARGTGEFFEIECGLVLPSIGYSADPINGIPFDERAGTAKSDNGRIEKGFYAVGWIRRGPTGVIGTNKPDGEAAFHQIEEDFPEGAKPGRSAFGTLLEERGVRAVTFDDWKKIEAAEIANAVGKAPRRKFSEITEMLAVLDA
jgi:NADPH-dependent glutamate synthase beta subunit-like oxidoreductase